MPQKKTIRPFKEKMTQAQFTLKERMLLFALRTYSANGKIPGTVTTKDGQKVEPKTVLKCGTDRLIRRGIEAGILTEIDGILVWNDYAVEESDVTYSVEDVERVRIANSWNKEQMTDWIRACCTAHGANGEAKAVLEFYQSNHTKGVMTAEAYLRGMMDVEHLERELIAGYLMRFGSDTDLAKGQFSKAKRALDAVMELHEMLNTGKFWYNGIQYDVPRRTIISALQYLVNTKQEKMRFKNNNYLKVYLRHQPHDVVERELGVAQKSNVAKTIEGY